MLRRGLLEKYSRLNPEYEGPNTMDRGQRPSIVVDNTRRSIPAWQDRIRDPSLTVLLVLQFCAIFVAAPLAAKGLLVARMVADTLVLAVLAVVVMLSRKWGAIVVILLGLAAYVASFLPTGEWSPVSSTIARHGGEILAFSALVWVGRARGLCPWPHYIAAPSGCDSRLSELRGDFRRGL